MTPALTSNEPAGSWIQPFRVVPSKIGLHFGQPGNAPGATGSAGGPASSPDGAGGGAASGVVAPPLPPEGAPPPPDPAVGLPPVPPGAPPEPAWPVPAAPPVPGAGDGREFSAAAHPATRVVAMRIRMAGIRIAQQLLVCGGPTPCCVPPRSLLDARMGGASWAMRHLLAKRR